MIKVAIHETADADFDVRIAGQFVQGRRIGRQRWCQCAGRRILGPMQSDAVKLSQPGSRERSVVALFVPQKEVEAIKVGAKPPKIRQGQIEAAEHC
jgi:hypothetical protein